MKNYYLAFFVSFLAFQAFGQIPVALVGSCQDTDAGTITLFVDYSQNCVEADPNGLLAGQMEVGMHSGVNMWASSVPFDDANAMTFANLGNGIFTVVINTMDYYGVALADISTLHVIGRDADPNVPWDAETGGSIRDETGMGGFGGDELCEDFIVTVAELPNCADLAQESSASLFGSTTTASTCVDSAGGNITIEFDLAKNCPEADTSNLLAGATALGFHSGANDWASAISWDDAGAMSATNNGNDIFSVTVNTMDYYGVALDSLNNIKMVMNNGVDNPAAPWDNTGRDERDGGFGGTEPCSDLVLLVSELAACPVVPDTATSVSLLLTEGDMTTCKDPETGRVRIAFDNSRNCPEADTMGLLAGTDSLGYHSGANMWASAVAWDDDGALPAINNGSDIFYVTVDVMEYYGIDYDSLNDIQIVMNSGFRDPTDPWGVTGRDQRDGGFGGNEPCSDLVIEMSELATCDLSDVEEAVTSTALTSEAAGSCVDGMFRLVKVAFDQSLNCPEADTANVLAGASALGYHSGANNWASVVAWDDAGAQNAVNDGNNVFSTTFSPLDYYNVELDSLNNIQIVMNNGVENPADAWSVTGKDDRDGGFGGNEPCSDMVLDFSEAKSCDLSLTATSPALYTGLASSCADPDNGLIRLEIDLAYNCPEADSAGLLNGATAIGFHSGINEWQNQVPWNDVGAMSAMNDGNDKFSLTIDAAAYYGIDFDSINVINFLFNNGIAAPDDPWSNQALDSRDGTGFGGSPCSNLAFMIGEMETCDLSTGTIDLTRERSIKVSPNPFSQEVKIEFENTGNESFNLVITDITGKVVRQMNNLNGSQVIIQRNELTAGMYFASLRDQSSIFATAKLVVQ